MVRTKTRVIALRWVNLCLLLVWLAGCATHGLPPVADRSPVFGARPAAHQIHAGDTLYSIAWRYGLETAQLASWNNIQPPYLLSVGRRLRLSAPQPNTVRRPVPPKQRPGVTQPIAVPASRWTWPIAGATPLALVSRHYHPDQPGMRFQLPSGSAARAAASGEVVYAGNGLGGYEHLVILRHAGELLSAYSFDGRAKVTEGTAVRVAQSLADIASAGSRASTLYFEVRRKGVPVDPRTVIQ